MTDIRVGISGWRYAPWRGDFYPAGLPQRRELEFASRCVNSIEINGSFYALQTPQRYAGWHDEAPSDFIFSVKAPRYITHVRRLQDVEVPVANFFASGIFALKKKLGPILWQFPPSFKFDAAVFEKFLKLLPRSTARALDCASHSDERLHKEGYLQAPVKKRLRHAVEIRNDSFVCDEFIDLLRRFNMALVVADTAGKWPYIEEVTSDFMYLRLHGDEKLYSSGYSDAALNRWQKRIELWSQGDEPHDAHRVSKHAAEKRAQRDIYCYFDNDIKVRAPYDARSLLERLNLAATLEAKPGDDFAAHNVSAQQGAA